MERNIKNDVRIDRFKLEEECEKQASLYHHWADGYATAKALTDNLRVKEKFIRAKTAKVFRENPPDGKKLTEAGVQEQVEVHEDIVAVVAALNDSLEIKYHLEAAVDSMDKRDRQLNNLVNLYIRGYYQGHIGGKPSTDALQTEQRQHLNNQKTQNNPNQEE